MSQIQFENEEIDINVFDERLEVMRKQFWMAEQLQYQTLVIHYECDCQLEGRFQITTVDRDGFCKQCGYAAIKRRTAI